MAKEKNLTWIWCGIIAFVMLALCSRSSFLYKCNDWNDAQSFFTMGKAMMNGQVLYRDLFEQKGPYLYLIYGIAWIISKESFFGVYVLETIALTICLCYSMLTMQLFCKRRVSYGLIPIMAFSICASKSFYWGGSAEEFCLPFLAISLYHMLKPLKEGKTPTIRVVLFNGIVTGIIALIKYTLLGFYAAWIGMVFFMLIGKKQWKQGIKYFGAYFLGIVVAFLPWVVYFTINEALDDWYHCYIYVNVFLYGNGKSFFGNGIGQKVYELTKILYWLIFDNWMYFGFIILGMLGLLICRNVSWYAKIQVYFLFGLLFLGIYIGGANLFYYSLPLSIFTALGLGMIGLVVDKVSKRDWVKKELTVICGIMLIISMMGAKKISVNTPYILGGQDDIFLYKMKAIIEQEEEPTLLNYGCLDAGLYTVTGIMPTCKYYHQCNVAYEEMSTVQKNYIEEGITQFVLARDSYPENIEKCYDLVIQEQYEQYGIEFTYYLFKRK